MTGREKRMAGVVGVLVGAFLVWQVALPVLDDALFSIKETNRRLQADAEALDRRLHEVEGPRATYRAFLERAGTTDPEQFKTLLYNRLTELANKAGFSNLRMQPSPISEYKPAGWRRKSDIRSVRFTINAEGTLESVMGFVKDFYELPYISQITSMNLDAPSDSSRRRGRGRRGPRKVTFRMTIEALVPPLDKEIGQVNPELLASVDRKVKHKGRDYALIWNRDPFKEYVPPPPEVKPPPVVRIEPKPPPPAPPVGDPEAPYKVIRMAMIYGDEAHPYSEVLVFNTRTHESEYVSVGQELDGGVVRMVHPWGVVARRKDGQERVYPVKKTLAESLPLDASAEDYPELVYAYRQFKEREAPGAGQKAGGVPESHSGSKPNSAGKGEPGKDGSGKGQGAIKQGKAALKKAATESKKPKVAQEKSKAGAKKPKAGAAKPKAGVEKPKSEEGKTRPDSKKPKAGEKEAGGARSEKGSPSAPGSVKKAGDTKLAFVG